MSLLVSGDGVAAQPVSTDLAHGANNARGSQGLL